MLGIWYFLILHNLLNYLNYDCYGDVFAGQITLSFAFEADIGYNIKWLSTVSWFIMCDAPGIEEVIWVNGN